MSATRGRACWRRCATAGAAACLALTAACAELPAGFPFAPPAETAAPEPVRAAPAPLFAFLETAGPGARASLEDPETGGSVTVVAGRRYRAASGRDCRRFSVVAPGTWRGLSAGLACRGPDGRWTLSELRINPVDLETPRLGYP